MSDITGTYVNIKRFEIHDGDGLRTTLFLKGCPLRCKWCHNPETLGAAPILGYYAHKCIGCGRCAAICPAHTVDGSGHHFDRAKCTACGKCAEVCLGQALLLYGKRTTAEAILPELLSDKDFYDASGGGVTVSGGEPLLQYAFCAELFRLLKENGVNTALDTCLCVPRKNLDAVLPFVDTFLVDVKAVDCDLHEKLTGRPNTQILENLRYLDSLGKRIEIRIPYIPGQNSGQIEAIGALLSTLRIVGARVLPYHNFSGAKYESVDIPYALPDTPMPTPEEVNAARETLRRAGVHILDEQ